MAQLEKKWGIETRNFNAECPPPPIAHTGPPSVSSFRVQRSSECACNPSAFSTCPVQTPTGRSRQRRWKEPKGFRRGRILRGTSVAEGTSITHIELARSWEGGPTWSTAEKATGWANVTCSGRNGSMKAVHTRLCETPSHPGGWTDDRVSTQDWNLNGESSLRAVRITSSAPSAPLRCSTAKRIIASAWEMFSPSRFVLALCNPCE